MPMKKNLIPLAALAFVAAATAQTPGSSVTLWGVLDADIGHYSQGGVSETMMGTPGNTTSQLGFRGTEDIAGGLSANFWLESQLDNRNGGIGGATFFSRRSTVSLAGSFGEIRLGRDYTPSFWNHFMFDPFRSSGPGTGTNITFGGLTAGGANPLTAVRASNSIQYLWGFAPNAQTAIGHGLYAQLMYAFAGNTSSEPSIGRYEGGRIGYWNGPVNGALAYGQSHGAPIPGETGLFTTFKEWNLGGSYNFGPAKAMAHYGVNNSDVPGTKYTHWGLAATINAGPGYIPISYNQIRQNNATSDGANQIAVGYVYNLSKRTALYATVSHISNKNSGRYTFFGGAASNSPNLFLDPNFTPSAGGGWGNGTGYDVGIRTEF